MRAIQVAHFGGPEVLRCVEVERPSPISTEVLVRVIAAGVNPVDCKTRRGEGVARWVGPPPFILGWDVCGVVEAMGYGVTRFEVGDLVYGMPWFPRAARAYAEFVTAPSRQLARVPDGISPVEAAAIPLAAITAMQSLIDTAHILNGQTVLVHGAGWATWPFRSRSSAAPMSSQRPGGAIAKRCKHATPTWRSTWWAVRTPRRWSRRFGKEECSSR